MTKTPQQQVDELLEKLPMPKPGNAVASNPDLAAAVTYFLKLKAEGHPSAHVSLTWFYNHALKPRFDGPSMSTVLTYVREILKLNPKTGKPQ